MYKMFKRGAEGQMYRKFWASVLTKGIIATAIVSLLLSLGDDKDAIERWKLAWRAGNMRWLDADITGIYRYLGGTDEKRKYFSIFGHFKDPMKFVFHPVRSMQHKGSVIYRFFHEALTGVNWKGDPYTAFGELMGTTGEGGLKGQLTKEGKGAPLEIGQIPAFILAQARGVQPVQFQNFMAWMGGEMDGFDAIAKSIGLMTASATPKTEAQNFIADYYSTTLPNKNLTPAEKEHNKLRKDFLKQARSGDMEGMVESLTQAVEDKKFSNIQAKDLIKEAQQPEGVASFYKLPLDVALKAWDVASDQEKELWGPALLKKVAGAQPDTRERNKEGLQTALHGLGMDDAADALDNMQVKEFKPGPLIDPSEFLALSDLDQDQIDDFLTAKIMGNALGMRSGTRPTIKQPGPTIKQPGSGGQKEKLRRLGLG